MRSKPRVVVVVRWIVIDCNMRYDKIPKYNVCTTYNLRS